MIHISSNDVDTGDKSNGTWNLNSTLSGAYVLDQFYITSNHIPWIYSPVNELFVTTDIDGEIEAFTITFDECSLSDTAEISTFLQTQISNALTENSYDLSVAVIYLDASDPSHPNTYRITFSRMAGAFTINFSWSNEASTCANIFEKTDNEAGPIFYLPDTNINATPKWLECYIDEATSRYITSRSSRPTLILSIQDDPYTGQDIMFNNNVETLSISFYRLNESESHVPFSNDWDMILKPK